MNANNLHWTERYSDTMESDKRGRWARIAYVAHPDSIDSFGFVGDRVGSFQIAWVEKYTWEGRPDNIQFRVSYNFPVGSQRGLFATLEEAKADVEEQWAWLMQCANHEQVR